MGSGFAGDGKPFKAKYPGRCEVCDFEVLKGEDVHYTAGKFAHETCRATEDLISTPDLHTPVADEPSYRQKGKRVRKVCGTCYLQHAGTCDD